MTDPLNGSSRWTVASVCLLLVVAAAFRWPALGQIPPAINQDEASRGYDAWSILETGADRHQDRWPLFLKSFGPGDYAAALPSYLMIPFVAVLGPTPLAFRLPSAICSVATVLLLFDWLRRRFKLSTALVAGFILAADPWHILVTRTGYEFAFVPFFMILGFWALQRAIDTREKQPGLPSHSGGWLMLAAGSAAMTAWTYSGTRLFIPLFLIAACLIYRRELIAIAKRPADRVLIVKFVIALILFASPMWWTLLTQREHFAARAQVALFDFRPSALSSTLPQVAVNYLRYFQPQYIWTQPDYVTMIWIPGVGLHLWVAAPFILLGQILIIVRARQNRFDRLLLAWWLLSPVPAAICKDLQPHIVRAIAIMPLIPVFGGIGGAWLVDRIARFGRAGLACIAMVGCCFIANAAYLARQYFSGYAQIARLGFQTSLVEAMEFISSRSQNADFILVTNRVNQPYIYALLYGRIPPRELASLPIIAAPGPGNFDHVVHVGRFYFAPLDPTIFLEDMEAFKREWAAVPDGARGLVVEAPGVFREGELLASFGSVENPDDIPLEVRQWTKH
ncbi:MAG TPA: glycosyltransferase family 39 protein [Phycisphaerae bacterium]|nr:glycosyltransferase family 39 protein [Phycisphaerae bacterium]